MTVYYSEGGWGAWDIHESYSRTANSILGIIQVICGLLSMALGVGAICTWATYWKVAYGIWCGFIFAWAGGICIGAARHKNTCLIMTTLLLSGFSIVLACVQFGLGVAATVKDSDSRRQNIVAGKYADQYLLWDIYYRKNNPHTYACAGEDYGLSFSSAWGPVDILLLVTAFIELVTAIVEVVLCSVTLCCGPKDVRHQYYADQVGTGTTGFSNDAFVTESRSLSPPLYKVTM